MFQYEKTTPVSGPASVKIVAYPPAAQAQNLTLRIEVNGHVEETLDPLMATLDARWKRNPPGDPEDPTAEIVDWSERAGSVLPTGIEASPFNVAIDEGGNIAVYMAIAGGVSLWVTTELTASGSLPYET